MSWLESLNAVLFYLGAVVLMVLTVSGLLAGVFGTIMVLAEGHSLMWLLLTIPWGILAAATAVWFGSSD